MWPREGGRLHQKLVRLDTWDSRLCPWHMLSPCKGKAPWNKLDERKAEYLVIPFYSPHLFPNPELTFSLPVAQRLLCIPYTCLTPLSPSLPVSLSSDNSKQQFKKQTNRVTHLLINLSLSLSLQTKRTCEQIRGHFNSHGGIG